MLRYMAQKASAQALLFAVFDDAVKLAYRFKESEMLHKYVLDRLWLVVLGALLIVVTSIAATAGTVLYLAGTRSFLLLLAILLTPIVLLGSLFVLAYVFLAWLEERALARAFPHHKRPAPGWIGQQLRRHLGVDMGVTPRVPWVLATIVLFLPLLLFFLLSPAFALPLIVLLVLAPIGYARLDR